MSKNPSLKAAAISLSTVFFSCLVAHGQSTNVVNVVFTEQSSSVLTETLNGAPVGNWQYFGTYWLAQSIVGTVSSPLYTYLNFMDPINPSASFVLYPFPGAEDAYGNFPTANLPPGGGPPLPLSDYLPYSTGETEVVIDGSGDLAPANITVQTVPEPSTWVLLILGSVALAVWRNHYNGGARLCRAVIRSRWV